MKLRIFNEFDIQTVGDIVLGLSGATALNYARNSATYDTSPFNTNRTDLINY